MEQTDREKMLKLIHAQTEELAFKSFVNENVYLYAFKVWNYIHFYLKKNLQNAKKDDDIEPVTSCYYFYTYPQICFLQWESDGAQIYTKTLWLSLMNIYVYI